MTIRSTGDVRADDFSRQIAAMEEEMEALVSVIHALEGVRDRLLVDTWKAYVLTGVDTDGDTMWHCSPEEAGRALVEAVRSLRADYDLAIEE